MYIYKYICKCLHIYICVYIYMCVYVCAYIYIYVHICVSIYTCIYICICVHICIYVNIYVHSWYPVWITSWKGSCSLLLTTRSSSNTMSPRVPKWCQEKVSMCCSVCCSEWCSECCSRYLAFRNGAGKKSVCCGVRGSASQCVLQCVLQWVLQCVPRLWRWFRGKGITTYNKTLHLTAILCNTLQHFATLCDTLQNPATHCNTLQHPATLCNKSSTLFNALQSRVSLNKI